MEINRGREGECSLRSPLFPLSFYSYVSHSLWFLFLSYTIQYHQYHPILFHPALSRPILSFTKRHCITPLFSLFSTLLPLHSIRYYFNPSLLSYLQGVIDLPTIITNESNILSVVGDRAAGLWLRRHVHHICTYITSHHIMSHHIASKSLA